MGGKQLKNIKRVHMGTANPPVLPGSARLLAVISNSAGRADSFSVLDQVC
jgi:hypothetical protein